METMLYTFHARMEAQQEQQRRETAERRAEVVAKILIGGEAIDDGVGALILAGSSDAGFEVFVSGGALPDGQNFRGFFGHDAHVRALEFFLAIARELAVDAIEVQS